jgi:hypothetical protein
LPSSLFPLNSVFLIIFLSIFSLACNYYSPAHNFYSSACLPSANNSHYSTYPPAYNSYFTLFLLFSFFFSGLSLFI